MNLQPQSWNLRGLAALTVLLIAAIYPAALEAQACSGQTPAFSVPENLWLDGVFRPGDTGSPTNQIPSERDSTTWNSLLTPGFHTGLEFFESLEVAGDYLYVGYNAGISVWNIAGANAENPDRVAVRDGWHRFACQQSSICGPFLSFPDPGENDFLVEDIAILPQGNITYIALSGRSAVGTSLWQFNTANETLTPIFQDVTRVSRQVRLVEDPGTSTIYAFASGDRILSVYDFSRAVAIGPCLEDETTQCSGVYLGNLGTVSAGHYLDLLQRPTGEILVAVADGDTDDSQGLELWEVTNPASPGTANQLFNGLNEKTYGVALFKYEGSDYLAALERVGSSNVIKIWDISACRGSCPLGVPIFDDVSVPPRISNQFLTYSTSNGTPFLHYSGFATSPGGPHYEQLLNLTTLGRPGQNITEMTDGAPTYFDDCRGQNLDYWAWYYPANEFGLKNMTPSIGKFHPQTNVFYRTGRSILEAHVWEAGVNPPDPAITTTVSDPDPQGLYWMTDEITFQGEGSNGCNPAGVWNWMATTPPSVNAITVSEISNRVTYRFECDTVGRCDDAIVSVVGSNSDASCSGATLTAAAITVKDPSVDITSIDPSSGTFTQCTNVDFTAGLVGRGPANLLWTVRRDPALDPEQNPQQTLDDTVTDEDLSTSPSMFTWDTASASFAEIFSDGFESGDLTAWDLPPMLAENFVVQVGLNRRGTSLSATVELNSISGDPAFGSPPIEFTTIDNATFDFQANTVAGTVSEWNWELEDDEGQDLCTFGVDINVPCTLKSGQNISHTWVLQNGARRVDLTIGNCQTATTAEASTTVSVVSLEQLEVTNFELDRFQSAGACEIDADCLFDLICVCHVDQTVFFEVVATGSPDFYDFDWDGNGTFEDTGNPATGTEYTTVYPVAIGQVVPAVRARRGASPPAEKDLRETLDIQP